MPYIDRNAGLEALRKAEEAEQAEAEAAANAPPPLPIDHFPYPRLTVPPLYVNSLPEDDNIGTEARRLEALELGEEADEADDEGEEAEPPVDFTNERYPEPAKGEGEEDPGWYPPLPEEEELTPEEAESRAKEAEARRAEAAEDYQAYQEWLNKLSEEDRAAFDEVEWMLDKWFPQRIIELKNRITGCSLGIHKATAANLPAPIKGGSEAEGLIVAGIVSCLAVHALRVQITLPGWNNGEPYAGIVGGGRKIAIPTPAQLTLKNHLMSAMAYLGEGVDSLPLARRLANKLCLHLERILSRFNSNFAPPTEPSDTADRLTAFLDPPPPEGLLVDVAFAGKPTQVYISAYVLKPRETEKEKEEREKKEEKEKAEGSSASASAPAADDGESAAPIPAAGAREVLQARHVALPLCDELISRLKDLSIMADEAKGLLRKIEVLEELNAPEPPARKHGPWGWAASSQCDWTNKGVSNR